MLCIAASLFVAAATAAPLPAPTAPTAKPTPVQARARIVVGGGGINSIWNPSSDILEPYRGFPDGGVKIITAAGTNPVSSGVSLGNSFRNAGVETEWIPIHDINCDEAAYDEEIVAMVEAAVRMIDAIFYGGGQSGRLQSCLYGNYSQSGIDVDPDAMTPVLRALINKEIVGGSSAGAMNQPMSEILVTGHSVESYQAVSAGSVFQRSAGNRMLEDEELVDSHFSERGRQGRLMMIAMNTGQRWAFGIDEDTAYEWYPDEPYKIVGTADRDGIRGGVVVFKDTVGTSSAQSATMHFLTSGDTISTRTGEVVFNEDKEPCPRGELPEPSDAIFSSVNYRTISLDMAAGPTGQPLSNYHGNPPVEVRFTKLATTECWTGPSGTSFINLLVEQMQTPSKGTFDNSAAVEAMELPQDYMWKTDE